MQSTTIVKKCSRPQTIFRFSFVQRSSGSKSAGARNIGQQRRAVLLSPDAVRLRRPGVPNWGPTHMVRRQSPSAGCSRPARLGRAGSIEFEASLSRRKFMIDPRASDTYRLFRRRREIHPPIGLTAKRCRHEKGVASATGHHGRKVWIDMPR